MKKMNRVIVLLLIVALLAIPVYAAIAGENFTPSITQKGGPRTGRFRNPATGTEHPAVIVNDKGEIIDYVEEDCIEIIPLSEAEDEATPDEIENMLMWGYESLFETEMVDAVEDIAKALEERNTGKAAEDLVVYELFHITVCEDHKKMLEEGNKLAVKLELDFYQTVEFDMPIHAVEKDAESLKWIVMDEDALTYDEEEVRILTIAEPGLFALVTDKKN